MHGCNHRLPSHPRDGSNLWTGYLKHAGQRLGVRLAAWRQEVRHHGLAIIRVALHAPVIAPGIVQAVLQGGQPAGRDGSGPGQAAPQPPACIRPAVLTL